jgi:hypothetical protein
MHADAKRDPGESLGQACSAVRTGITSSKSISRRPEKSPSIPPSPGVALLASAKRLAAVAGADPLWIA